MWDGSTDGGSGDSPPEGVATDGTSDEALATIREIRTFLERGRDHSADTTLPAAPAVLAGAFPMAGGLLLHLDAELGFLPLARTTAFLTVWGAVLALTFVGSYALSELLARRRQLPVLSALARRLTVALLPAFLGAAAASVALVASGALEALPSLWLACYGAGLLCVTGLNLRPLAVVAAAFLVAATLWPLAPAGGRDLLLGLTFGVIHLTYAAILMLKGRDPWDVLDKMPSPAPRP